MCDEQGVYGPFRHFSHGTSANKKMMKDKGPGYEVVLKYGRQVEFKGKEANPVFYSRVLV